MWNYRRPDWVGVLSEDGSELLWQHFFLSEYVKKIIRIRIAANGDILGMGYSRNPVLDYEASHWLFRLSPTGELLWEREYLRNEYFNNIGWRDNYLFDITETADGKIACVGSTTYSENGSVLENSVRLIVLDENGCLTPDCGDIIFLDVPEIEDNILLTEDKYPVYVSPNPAQTQVKIRYFLPEKHQTAIFQLYDIQGRLAQTHELATREHNYNFEVTDLAAGVYMYQVLLENEIVKSGKLVVRN